VPGHEIVGRITAVGNAVDGFKIGDIAGVGCMVDSCRQCASCKEGEEQYCEAGFTGTYNGPMFGGENTYGGYSDHIVVDEKYVLHVRHAAPTWPRWRRCCAPASPPIRRWRTGRWARARRSAWSASAGWATWA
jgi:uncharacterized zinc-type alcohol dehydrogenase-like protein